MKKICNKLLDTNLQNVSEVLTSKLRGWKTKTKLCHYIKTKGLFIVEKY